MLQMVIQGLWETKSPLLQLPHISEEMLRHFTTRKRNIRNIRSVRLFHVQQPAHDGNYPDLRTIPFS